MFNLEMRYHCHFIERQQIPTTPTKAYNTLCSVGHVRRCVQRTDTSTSHSIGCNVVLVPCSYILNSNSSRARHHPGLACAHTRAHTDNERSVSNSTQNLFTFLARHSFSQIAIKFFATNNTYFFLRCVAAYKLLFVGRVGSMRANRVIHISLLVLWKILRTFLLPVPDTRSIRWPK